jgi:hypothetical protein
MSTVRKGSSNFQKDPSDGGGGVGSSSTECSWKEEHRNKVCLSKKIDHILQAYIKNTSSAGNQDKILKVVQYSLWLLSRFYSKATRAAFAKLSDEVSWARYVNRFLGFPAAVEAARSGSWGSPKSIGKLMAWMMVGYYPLEHIAYLGWKTPDICFPNSTESRLGAKASAWSCRFWLGYILVDIVRSTIALSEKEKVDEETSLAVVRTERLQHLRNILYVLPALNWSLPNWDTRPLLKPVVCNTLMWLESVVCLYQGISS